MFFNKILQNESYKAHFTINNICVILLPVLVYAILFVPASLQYQKCSLVTLIMFPIYVAYGRIYLPKLFPG